MKLTLGRNDLDLSQPIVMGVLNVTPDSFSDGGQFVDFDIAKRHAEAMRKKRQQVFEELDWADRLARMTVLRRMEQDAGRPHVTDGSQSGANLKRARQQ